MDEYIKTLQEMLDKYERMPDVFDKLLPVETQILTGSNYCPNCGGVRK